MDRREVQQSDFMCNNIHSCKCKDCFNNAHSGCVHCIRECDGEDNVKMCKAFIEKKKPYWKALL